MYMLPVKQPTKEDSITQVHTSMEICQNMLQALLDIGRFKWNTATETDPETHGLTGKPSNRSKIFR